MLKGYEICTLGLKKKIHSWGFCDTAEPEGLNYFKQGT
jgi:hypothetical protein